MRKLLLFLGILLAPLTVLANSVEIEVSPANPIRNETFQVIFKINTTSETRPYISFDPDFAEVLGRKNGGVSISTTIVNGRVSTKREISYIFDLVTSRSGTLNLRKIVVDIEGQKIRVPDKKINILTQRKAARELFMATEVSNESPYIGEGINVNYYLYYRYSMNIMGHEILKFPVLNDFIKRFHLPTPKVETVEKDGFMFRRKLIYSARLYPEKEGKVKVDPIKVRVQYPARQRSGIGFFGFGLTQYRTKDLLSNKVDLEVKSMKDLNIPKNYTGLIGDHNFKLDINRNKFMVNEAIELKLVVEGEGALEKFEAPKFFVRSELEEFDTKSSFEEIDLIKGRKTFEYTYLARKGFESPAGELRLSLFDKNTQSFIEKVITIPEIIVTGQAFSGYSNQETSNSSVSSKNEKFSINDVLPLKGIIGPQFSPGIFSSNWLKILNGALILFNISFLLSMTFGFLKIKGVPKEVIQLSKGIQKDGPDYHSLFRILYYLKPNSSKEEDDIQNILEKSSLSDDAKNYFKQALKDGEKVSFSDEQKGNIHFQFKQKYFKELYQRIKDTPRDENI